MAPHEPTETEVLNARLVAAIEKISENQDAGPIKQISLGRTKNRTPWNPSGEKRKVKLNRVFYQSGFRVKEAILSDDEIRLLNRVKPGMYNGRKWVVLEKTGGDGIAELDIYWPNQTIEQRIQFAQETSGRGLIGALEKILSEADAISA